MSGQGGLSAVRELERALAADARIALVDASLVNAATTGIGYTGSTNMSRAEAGQLGAAIGCDFFITGVARTATRSVRAAESHEETIIGLMLVDGRTGALVAFDFIAKTGPDQISASDAAIKTLASRAVEYVDRAAAYHASRTAITSGPDTQRGRETIEDLPEPDSLRAQGFVPPEFTNRVKPHYSDEADRADISATVEASVVFLSNGEVGETEITRWAGFGLDESAISAIKQLKFKPATRDGNPVSVRALVQYNFRRSSGDVAPSLPRPVPEERKAPDLRELFKPKYVRPSASQ
jgi:TonB family protein